VADFVLRLAFRHQLRHVGPEIRLDARQIPVRRNDEVRARAGRDNLRARRRLPDRRLAPWIPSPHQAARLGVRIEFVQKQLSNRIPSAAKRSMCGVSLMRPP